MKRRIITIILIIVFINICAFASSWTIDLGGSPYSYQLITMRSNVHYNSTYGGGGDLGFSFNTGKINLGMAFQYSAYKYAEFTEPYRVFSLCAKIVFPKQISEKTSFDTTIKAGIDIRSIYSTSRVFPTLGLNTGFAFKISEKLALTTGIDLKITVQPSHIGYNNSIDFEAKGNLGLRVKL